MNYFALMNQKKKKNRKPQKTPYTGGVHFLKTLPYVFNTKLCVKFEQKKLYQGAKI